MFFVSSHKPKGNSMKTHRTIAGWLILLALLLLALPAVVQAQFTFTTNNGAITIIKYTGSGGAVTIPDTTNGWAVTSIGSGAFSNCTSLTSVTIGADVNSIESNAFWHCSSLTSVTIPNSVTNIGNFAFNACFSLTNAIIGNSVISIGSYAFEICTSLTNVIIGNSVTSIGSYAFYDCTSLTNVTIPNSVTSIGNNAFYFCGSLTSVTIGSSVTNIGNMAFNSCAKLTGVYFQGNAPSLGSSVFYVSGGNKATVYYLPGTTGWENFAQLTGLPTVLWNPQAQTSDASFGVRTNQFGFNIVGSSNLVVVVEACTNLATPIWTPIGTNMLNTFIGTNGSSYFSDPAWTNYPGRFYRLRSP
jgi:hypothetical protein